MGTFIIRYSPSWCEVFEINTLECREPHRPPCLIDQYEAQLSYLEKGMVILGSKEIFACNNSWWGRVEADTAAVAFTIFMDKLHKQITYTERFPDEFYIASAKKLREGIPFTNKEET